MVNTNIIKKIRNKEMDRKEFLQYVGMALLGLIGLRGIIALITKSEKSILNSTQHNRNHGFGGGKYGM